MKRFISWIISLVSCSCVAAATAEPLCLTSQRGSSQPPPAAGNGDSAMPLLTPDGRYVVFASSADNLVAVNGSNSLPYQLSQKLNVFLRDRTNGTTTLISVNQAGIGGDGDSVPAAISANGRFVLFESGADDLVAGDTNGVTDVFLRDVWSKLTVLVSVSTNGGVGNGVSRDATLTPDGRWVALQARPATWWRTIRTAFRMCLCGIGKTESPPWPAWSPIRCRRPSGGIRIT